MPNEKKNQRVLICEDDPASLLLLQTVLEKRGYEIVGEATTGIEAIKLYDEKKPDMVLLDINMPKGGGITTLRFMRELDKTPYIVMLTGDNSKFNVETTKKLGANDYLLKSSVQKSNFLDRLKSGFDSDSFDVPVDESEEPIEEEIDKNPDEESEEETENKNPKKPYQRMVRALNQRGRR